jgi:hypothetical protein
MSKATLFQSLKKQYNIERLQRVDKRNRKRKFSDESNIENSDSVVIQESSSSSSRPKRSTLNKYDPIMLSPIGKKVPTFKFVRPNGTAVRFVLDSLVDYLVSSGDFYDPETRIPFSDEDLKQIDLLVRNARLDKPSVWIAKNNTQIYRDARFQRDAMQALERCAGEVVADMLNVVENNDPDDAQMQLVMREFPSFLDYYNQIKDADQEYASKCLEQWMLLIKGPPNRPTYDEYGIIHAVTHFFRCVRDGVI